jgi:hypothetical protein
MSLISQHIIPEIARNWVVVVSSLPRHALLRQMQLDDFTKRSLDLWSQVLLV